MVTPEEMRANRIARYARVATSHAAVALLWQASDASDAGNGFPIDEVTPSGNRFTGEGAEHIDAVIPLIREAVTAFVNDNYDVLTTAKVSAAQAGHDIILTANGHGAGFWDRGLGEAGDKLTAATRGYSFDAEFELWGDRADGTEHCPDELCWLMVENTVIIDLIGASA